MDYEKLKKQLEKIDKAESEDEKLQLRNEAKSMYTDMKKSLGIPGYPDEDEVKPKATPKSKASWDVNYHTYDNPFLRNVIEQYKPIPSIDDDCVTRIIKAGGMGVAGGIIYQLCYFPWYFTDPIESNGPKGREMIRSQWPRFFKGFGRPVAFFTSTSMIFSGVECLFQSLREGQDDAVSYRYKDAGYGGFAAGLFMASITKRFDTMMLSGVLTGGFMAALEWHGLSLVNNPYRQALKVGGKRPMTHVESKELSALKGKYPQFADL